MMGIVLELGLRFYEEFIFCNSINWYKILVFLLNNIFYYSYKLI